MKWVAFQRFCAACGGRTFWKFAAALLLFGMLAACSGETVFDPSSAEVTLSTSPSPPIAGQEAVLTASFAGMQVSNKALVKFDVRIGESPNLLTGKKAEEGSYNGSFTFPEAGVYDVYVHLYEGDLHLMKKMQVEVK